MKNALIENHICRFNDGEQICDCFVEGIKAQHQAMKDDNQKIVDSIKVQTILLAVYSGVIIGILLNILVKL